MELLKMKNTIPDMKNTLMELLSIGASLIAGKETACNAGDHSWIPGLERFHRESPWTEEKPGQLQSMGS